MTEKAPRYDDGIADDGTALDGSDAKYFPAGRATENPRTLPVEIRATPVATPGAFELRADDGASDLDETIRRSDVRALWAGRNTAGEESVSTDAPVAEALSALEDAYNSAAQRIVGVESSVVEPDKSPREQAENAAHAAREQLSDDEATAVWWYAVEFNRLQTADPKDYRAQNNIIARMSELKAKIGTADGKRVASMYEAAYSIK